MRRPKPNYGKQRSATRPISVARSLPKLQLPVSAARPKPQVGKPGPGGGVKGGRNG